MIKEDCTDLGPVPGSREHSEQLERRGWRDCEREQPLPPSLLPWETSSHVPGSLSFGDVLLPGRFFSYSIAVS